MVDGQVIANPKGIFRRDRLGQSTTPTEVTVERGRIRFFSEVLGESNPIHFDVAEARALGYPDIVAPPSFFMVIEADADKDRAARGEVGGLEFIGADFRYLLHGSERYDYHGLIFAGDTVSFSMKVDDFYDKKGGAMEFVQLGFSIVHAERGLLVSGTRTLLHRLG